MDSLQPQQYKLKPEITITIHDDGEVWVTYEGDALLNFATFTKEQFEGIFEPIGEAQHE